MKVPVTGSAFQLTLTRCPDGTVRYEVTDGICPICGGICLRQNVNGRLFDDTSYRHCTNTNLTCTWSANEPAWLPGMALGDDHEKLLANALIDVRQARGETGSR